MKVIEKLYIADIGTDEGPEHLLKTCGKLVVAVHSFALNGSG